MTEMHNASAAFCWRGKHKNRGWVSAVIVFRAKEIYVIWEPLKPERVFFNSTNSADNETDKETAVQIKESWVLITSKEMKFRINNSVNDFYNKTNLNLVTRRKTFLYFLRSS